MADIEVPDGESFEIQLLQDPVSDSYYVYITDKDGNIIVAFTSAGNTILTGIQINDTSEDHQYVFAVNELTADRTVTLPLLTGNDEFVFKDHAVTLTNKTLTTPTIGDFTNATHDHEDNAGGGKLDHGDALDGLADDDHTQYILVNGTRAFSGNQSLGGNDLTNVGDIDASTGTITTLDGTTSSFTNHYQTNLKTYENHTFDEIGEYTSITNDDTLLTSLTVPDGTGVMVEVHCVMFDSTPNIAGWKLIGVYRAAGGILAGTDTTITVTQNGNVNDGGGTLTEKSFVAVEGANSPTVWFARSGNSLQVRGKRLNTGATSYANCHFTTVLPIDRNT